MPDTVSVETQGISPGLDRADGTYDPVARGDLSRTDLLGLLNRVRVLALPAIPDTDDVCPPHVMTEGAAGRFSFVMESSAIYCQETECGIDPVEAADLATGRQSVAAVVRRHAGPAVDAAFGRRCAHSPGEDTGARPVRVPQVSAQSPSQPRSGKGGPARVLPSLVGFGVAAVFFVGGLMIVGAGFDETSGPDLIPALFMGGLMMVVGVVLASVARKTNRQRGRVGRRTGGRGGAWSGRRDDTWGDSDRDDRDRHGGRDDGDDDGDDGGDDGGDGGD